MNDALVARLATSEDVNLAYALNTRTALQVQLDRHDELRATAASTSALFERYQMPYYLERWALLLSKEGRPRAAARLIGRELALLDRWRLQAHAPTVEAMETSHAMALERISEATWQDELAQGRTLDAAGALALLAPTPPEA